MSDQNEDDTVEDPPNTGGFHFLYAIMVVNLAPRSPRDRLETGERGKAKPKCISVLET
jgi:hypothetical protein